MYQTRSSQYTQYIPSVHDEVVQASERERERERENKVSSVNRIGNVRKAQEMQHSWSCYRKLQSSSTSNLPNSFKQCGSIPEGFPHKHKRTEEREKKKKKKKKKE